MKASFLRLLPTTLDIMEQSHTIQTSPPALQRTQHATEGMAT
jgi:hypothetical protein